MQIYSLEPLYLSIPYVLILECLFSTLPDIKRVNGDGGTKGKHEILSWE